jgi:host factor-I protein
MTTEAQQYTQDGFLDSLIQEGRQVSAFLVNGIKLVGAIKAKDTHALFMLNKDGDMQMIYKHAVSTIVPNKK